jgi:hypothetical protein
LLWALVVVLAFSGPAGAADRSKLNVYTANVSAATAAELVQAGFDVVETEATAAGVTIELVLSASEHGKLRS